MSGIDLKDVFQLWYYDIGMPEFEYPVVRNLIVNCFMMNFGSPIEFRPIGAKLDFEI